MTPQARRAALLPHLPASILASLAVAEDQAIARMRAALEGAGDSTAAAARAAEAARLGIRNALWSETAHLVLPRPFRGRRLQVELAMVASDAQAPDPVSAAWQREDGEWAGRTVTLEHLPGFGTLYVRIRREAPEWTGETWHGLPPVELTGRGIHFRARRPGQPWTGGTT
jgi:hypothetical protein